MIYALISLYVAGQLLMSMALDEMAMPMPRWERILHITLWPFIAVAVAIFWN